MKKLYKTMKDRPVAEPRDLSREWHSDCLSPQKEREPRG
jgi:hypothetical protein